MVLEARVIGLDSFGNYALDVTEEQLHELGEDAGSLMFMAGGGLGPINRWTGNRRDSRGSGPPHYQIGRRYRHPDESPFIRLYAICQYRSGAMRDNRLDNQTASLERIERSSGPKGASGGGARLPILILGLMMAIAVIASAAIVTGPRKYPTRMISVPAGPRSPIHTHRKRRRWRSQAQGQ